MEIVKIADVGVDTAAAQAAGVIAQGGIIVYPTDTLYGIGVNALNADALARMYELKGREKNKPSSILVPSVDAIAQYAVLSPQARAMAEKHLPGALTLVLPALENVPPELVLDGGVAVRVPDDSFALTLAMMSEFPITATSANLAGEPTGATIPDIMRQFGEKTIGVDLLIDGGAKDAGTPSTVVSFTGDVPQVLREGAIPKEELGL